MNQISEDHEKLRNVLISKLGLPTDRFQRDNQIAEAVGKLLHERGELLDFYRKLGNHLKLPTVRLDSDFFHMVDRLRTERDKAVRSLESAGFTDNGGQMWKPPIGTPPPYLSQEIRYVLHGDIQPCTVLYSDDTTTLLRLDEGDIMCETDTIEWSDSVTYRCQELLKDVKGTTLSVLSQLVRDERILLNDDALETVSDEPSPMVVPSAPAVMSQPSCGNPYVHTSVEYPEAAMRAAGWQTEDLVQNGYGFYKPAQLATKER